MGRIAAPFTLALILLLGLALRLAPFADRHLAADERDLGASAWLIDDPGTAAHLRRIELTLAEGRAPLADPFLAHPGGAEIPRLPVFDALVAGAAQRWLAYPDGDPALGGVDEHELEDFVARLAPILGMLGLAVTAWVAWTVARGRMWAALLATALVAVAPATVRASEIGQIDAAAFALVLLALLARSTHCAVRAPDALSIILEALLAGVLAGLLSSLSAAGPLFALPTALALFVRAFRGPLDVRPVARRAGLLFAVVAAFVGRLPLADGPWQSLENGLVAHWAIAGSDLLLVLAAPFALLLLLGQRGPDRGARTIARIVALVAVLGLLVYEAPRMHAALGLPLGAWWDARDLRAAFDVSGSRSVLTGGALVVTLPGLLVAPGAVALAWRTRDEGDLHRASLLVIAFAAALAEPAFAPFAALAAALSLAGVLEELQRRADPRAAQWIGAGALLLLPSAAGLLLERPDPARREERIDFVAGLRWMRTGTEASGPFNSAIARSAHGVLVHPSAAELVAYHARRPAAASRAAAWTEPDLARRTFQLVQLSTYDELGAGLRARGLRWVVGAPRFLRPESANHSALSVLTLGVATLPGLTRIYAAARRVGPGGRALDDPALAAPVISIYAIDLPDEPREAHLRAR